MKLKHIAERYDVPEEDLEEFVTRYGSAYEYKESFWSIQSPWMTPSMSMV